MYIFFQCVAEAVAEKGVRGVAEFVPGGGAMFDIADTAWKKYRERCKDAQQRAEIQKLAQASFEEAKQVAVEAAQQAAANEPELLPALELFLTQIPASIRQSLKRADDPTGTTVPASFVLRGPEDVAKLLPPALPRFKSGDPLPGLPGWILERQLGVGGFGEVWLARKTGYYSLFGAVKFCRNLDSRDRDLLHESKVIDQILEQGQHPNIVKLLNVHLEGDTPWLMYEYVEGGDLTDLIHEWAGLPPTERQQKAIALLKMLAETVAHFHHLKPAIVHRDLKPANILRDKWGHLHITDFGISGIAAKHMIENETRGATTRAGRLQFTCSGSYTPLYASPQQCSGADPDPRDDVHALGVIGYQLLTGQVSQGVGPDCSQDLKEAGAGDRLVDLLGQCIAAKAERRPKDAHEFAAKIATISAVGPIAPEPTAVSSKPAREGTFSSASGRGVLAILVAALIPSLYLTATIGFIMWDSGINNMNRARRYLEYRAKPGGLHDNNDAYYQQLDYQFAEGERQYNNGVRWLVLAGIIGLITLIASMIGLHRMWRVVSRAGEDPTPGGDPTPGEAVGLLFVPFFNLYWMFRAVPGLSAALERELHERDPSRQYWTGWRTGLTACILLFIPFLNVASMLLFAVWINMADNATRRLIWLRKQSTPLASVEMKV